MLRATIVIPMLNEAEYAEKLLSSLADQAPPAVIEILVADGGSTDGTQGLVEKVSRMDRRIRMISNPARTQAAGVNRAAALAHPESNVLIRIDAHAEYPGTFVRALLAEFEAVGADSVVVRMKTVGRSCFQKAVASASNSWLGTGGSAHRMGGKAGFVDHGHHAAFSRAAFDGLGGYDPSMISNEDAEFDARLRASGGRIWLAAGIEFDYFPRASPMPLGAQYHRYGIGRAQNSLRHGELRFRQALPPGFVLALFGSLLLTPVHWTAWILPVGYLMAVVAAALYEVLRSRDLCCLWVAVALPVMHVSWATGFLRGLAGTIISRRSNR